jgi:hypothetical protein
VAENAQAVKETTHDVEKPAGEQLRLLCGLSLRTITCVWITLHAQFTRQHGVWGLTISQRAHTAHMHLSLSRYVENTPDLRQGSAIWVRPAEALRSQGTGPAGRVGGRSVFNIPSLLLCSSVMSVS